MQMKKVEFRRNVFWGKGGKWNEAYFLDILISFDNYWVSILIALYISGLED